MTCARCAREAPDGDRFCAACGAPLAGEAAVGADPWPATAPATVPAPELTAEAVVDAIEAAPSGPARTAPSHEPLVWTPPAPPAIPPPAYAGFWRRGVAMWVDAIVLFFPQAIVRVAMGLPVLSYTDEWGDRTALTAELLGVLVTFLYAAALECSAMQGTLGQQLFGLRVTDTRGDRIGFGRALAHQFAKIVSMLLCGFGYLLQLWNGRRQTLHDMLCGVLVIRVEEGRTVPAENVVVAS